MTTFTLKGFEEDVEVELTGGITEKQLLDYDAFQKWQTAMIANLKLQKNSNHPFHATPFSLKHIKIQSVDWAGTEVEKRLLFVKLHATVTNAAEQELPGIAFLRGGSVAVLMILNPKERRDERLVILTEQARIPAGSLAFKEIPAGMIDKGSKSFAGAAATEILEETGLLLSESDLVDLTELALKETKSSETTLEKAMYPSPGGCDEFIHIFLWIKELDRPEIEQLKGKLTGSRKSGESITLHVCDYEDLWREGARDAKTLAAWALYEGLNRSGVLPKELERRKEVAKGSESNEKEKKWDC